RRPNCWRIVRSGRAEGGNGLSSTSSSTRAGTRAPWDLLAKSGLLSQRLRLPTVCLVFVLLPRGFRSQGGPWRLEAAGAPTQQLWFREVPLWELEPEEWWERVPGLMALYPSAGTGERRRTRSATRRK